MKEEELIKYQLEQHQRYQEIDKATQYMSIPEKSGFIAGVEWADQHPRKGLWDAEKVCDFLKNKRIFIIKQEIEKLIERAQAERVLHPKAILGAKNLLLIEDYNKLLQFIDSLTEKLDVKNENSSDECPCCGWALDSDGCCGSCGYGRK